MTGKRHPRHGLGVGRVKGATGSLASVGLIAILTQGAAGCAVAGGTPQTHAGSSVIVQQGYASHGAETRITRYRDGLAVVTRDRAGTDITIQRGSPYSTARSGRVRNEAYGDRFDSPWTEERFESRRDHGHGSPFGQNHDTFTTRDAFRQRMFDRLDGHAPSW